MLITRTVTVRNISIEVHAVLLLRVAHHQRSTEAEICVILAAVVGLPPAAKPLGKFQRLSGRENR